MMHTERRSSGDERIRIDQRKIIRFDKNGGDRRTVSGRRSSDVRMEVVYEKNDQSPFLGLES